MSGSSFPTALAAVLRHEGGFVDHPLDPGGATNFGITRRTLERVRGKPVSVTDVRRMTRGEAAAIYRKLYWDEIRADDLPAGLDLALFDFAVNSGVSRAARVLQQALGVKADGEIGPSTLEAARKADEKAAIEAVTARRLSFLRSLNTWRTFGRGWKSRVNDTEKQALKLAASRRPVATA